MLLRLLLVVALVLPLLLLSVLLLLLILILPLLLLSVLLRLPLRLGMLLCGLGLFWPVLLLRRMISLFLPVLSAGGRCESEKQG